ncbi:MAG TPA: hypothetical protein PK213_03050 [Deltaproteobacteria bacterium]|nr:hypothetical protein [Deltaproteobacteria bacterium]
MSTAAQTRRHGSIVREMLKTPAYKDILRASLGSMAHGRESPATKALMEQDPEVFLALMASIPALVNMLLRSLTELGASLKGQYPPEILVAFIESVVDDIDRETLEKCGSVWQELTLSLWSASDGFRGKLLERALASGPKAVAGVIDVISQGIGGLEQDRPGAVSLFLKDLLSRVDRPAAAQSTRVLAEAVLDQKWHIASWAWGLATSRIRKRFGTRERVQG